MSETPLRSLVVVPRSHVDGTTDALLARRPLSERELASIHVEATVDDAAVVARAVQIDVRAAPCAVCVVCGPVLWRLGPRNT